MTVQIVNSLTARIQGGAQPHRSWGINYINVNQGGPVRLSHLTNEVIREYQAQLNQVASSLDEVRFQHLQNLTSNYIALEYDLGILEKLKSGPSFKEDWDFKYSFFLKSLFFLVSAFFTLETFASLVVDFNNVSTFGKVGFTALSYFMTYQIFYHNNPPEKKMKKTQEEYFNFLANSVNWSQVGGIGNFSTQLREYLDSIDTISLVEKMVKERQLDAEAPPDQDAQFGRFAAQLLTRGFSSKIAESYLVMLYFLVHSGTQINFPDNVEFTQDQVNYINTLMQKMDNEIKNEFPTLHRENFEQNLQAFMSAIPFESNDEASAAQPHSADEDDR